jgi:hypothetical protein
MKKRSKQFLTILMCAAIFSSFGCATGPQRAEPPRKPLYVREIAANGEIVLRNVNVDVKTSRADRNRRLSKCQVARGLHAAAMIYANPNLAAVYLQAALKK